MRKIQKIFVCEMMPSHIPHIQGTPIWLTSGFFMGFNIGLHLSIEYCFMLPAHQKHPFSTKKPLSNNQLSPNRQWPEILERQPGHGWLFKEQPTVGECDDAGD